MTITTKLTNDAGDRINRYTVQINELIKQLKETKSGKDVSFNNQNEFQSNSLLNSLNPLRNLPDKDERDQLSSIIENLTDKISGATDFGNDFFDTLLKTTNKVSDIVPEGATVRDGKVFVGLSTILYMLHRYIKDPTTLKAVEALVVSGGVIVICPLSDIITSLGSFAARIMSIFYGIFDLFKKKKENIAETEIQMQSGESIADAITGIYGACVFKAKGIKETLFNPREMSNIFRVSTSISDFFIRIQKFLCEIYNRYVAEQFGLSKIHIDLFEDPELVEFDNKVDELSERKASGELAYTEENLAFISALVDEGEIMYKKIPRTQHTNGILQLMYAKINEIKKIKSEFLNANISLIGFRQEPVGLLLRGGAGTMKSTLAQHFSAACNAFSLDKDQLKQFDANPGAYTFNRTSENEYWDGMTDTTNVVTIDDFGQARDVAGSPNNDRFEVIRAINSFEMPLHMAELGLKGKKKFNAKFVIATTNLKRVSAQSIISVEALMRRFGQQYLVVPKKRYILDKSQDRYSMKMDMSKVPKGADGQPNPLPEHFDFYVCDWNGDVTGSVHSFDQVVKRIKQDHDNRRTWKAQHEGNFFETSEKYKKMNDHLQEQGSSIFSDETTTVPDQITRDELMDYISSKSIPNSENWLDFLRENFPKKDVDMYERFLSEDNMLYEIASNYTLRDCFPSDTPNYKPIILGFFVFIKQPRYLLDGRGRMPVLDIPKFKSSTEVDRSLTEKIYEYYLKLKTQLMDVSASVLSSGLVYTVNILTFLKTTFVKHALVKITLLIGVVGIGVAYFFPSKSDQQGRDYTETKNSKIRKEVKTKTIKQMQREFAQQQGYDICGEQIMSKVLKKNVFEVFGKDDDNLSVSTGFITFTRDGYGLMPRHYIEQWFCSIQENPARKDNAIWAQDDSGLSVATTTLGEAVASSVEEGMEDSHMVLIKFNNCRPMCNITNRFITEDQITKLGSTFDVSIHVKRTQTTYNSKANFDCAAISTDDGVYRVPKSVRYAANTQVGDCGTPIVVRNARLGTSRIMGIHIAGQARGKDAYSGLITQEMLKEAYKELDMPEESMEGITETEEQSNKLFIETKYNVLGVVKEQHSPYGNTSLTPSPIGNSKPDSPWPASMKPAILKVSQGHDPYEKAMEKYCVADAFLNKRTLEVSVQDYRAYLFQITPDFKGLYTMEQAIWGDPSIEFCDSVSSSTSTGYPLKYTDSSLKKRLYGIGAIRTKENNAYDVLKARIDIIIKNASQNKRQLWIFTDNLKDEKRPIEKVDALKTRLFNGGPFDYLLTVKMYFGAFSTWIYSHPIDNGTCISINPFSSDWNDLARNLSSFEVGNDPLVGAGDFSGFDGSEMPVIHDEILSIINQWYDDGPRNARIRRVLWLEVTNSRHITGNLVYEWFASLPSGHPLTTIINCMYNHIAFRYCFFGLKKAQGKRFDECVKLQVLGDDNIFSVRNDFRDIFNEMRLPSMMKGLGLKYTTELKGVATEPWRKLSEVQFLKRSFRFETLVGEWVAPLSIVSVRETPLWTKFHDESAIFETNIDNFFRELSLHDRDVFNKYASKMRKGLDMLYPSFRDPIKHESQKTIMAKVLNKTLV